jgi:hypothetical protein
MFPPTDDLATGAGEDLGPDPCVARAKLIYTIDENNTFRSFTPLTLAFKVIGTLNCPAQFGATPFSMGVDRGANAWVLYSSGELFVVDTQTAHCTPTKFVPNQLGFDNFGMGYVSDAIGSTTEHLYISGLTNNMLGLVDPVALTVKTIGPLNGNPELSGTGNAQLWGFFPDAIAPRVSQIDKMTAKETTTFPLPALAGIPTAWAFAFWGGDFWIFLERDSDTSTHVYHLAAATGKAVDVVPNTGFKIVGAGVSTCAPTTLTH